MNFWNGRNCRDCSYPQLVYVVTSSTIAYRLRRVPPASRHTLSTGTPAEPRRPQCIVIPQAF